MMQLILSIGLGLLLAIPLLLYPFLYFFQERLLFFPKAMSSDSLQLLHDQAPKGEFRLTSEDGTTLHGWLVNQPIGVKRRPLLIYWGGNAEEISAFLLHDAIQFPDWAVLSVNYRGYGQSGGEPNEGALFADARLIYDWATRHPEIDTSRIVVMGRSLGSGVAVHVAAERPVAGVVLVSPYDSIRSVAQGVYPVVPVGWILKHPFDSLARAPSIHAPVLALMAREDRVIPLAHSNRLLAAWGAPYQTRVFDGVDHNSIVTAADYFEAIRAFLRSVASV